MGYAACVGDKRNACRVLVGKPDWRRQIRRPVKLIKIRSSTEIVFSYKRVVICFCKGGILPLVLQWTVCDFETYCASICNIRVLCCFGGSVIV